MPSRSARTVAALVLLAVACSGDGPAGDVPSATDSSTPAVSAEEPSEPASPGPTRAPTRQATPRPTDAAGTQPPPPARPRLRRVRLRLEKVADLREPTAMAVREGDPGIYVTERPGRIRVVRDGKVRTLLDWRNKTKGGHEQGMLGLDFSPDGAHLYVYYIGKGDEHSHLDEYRMNDNRLDRRSRREVLLVRQPEDNVHKGGQLTFGGDGLLYLALGDGGPSDVPPTTSQRLDTLLGKIVRIRPTPGARRPYEVPDANPFAGRRQAQGEIFALGLRNPWRFSFDRETGDMWIADVGRYILEEINVRGPGRAAGANYGWPYHEGASRSRSGGPDDVVAPLHTYPHEDRCAVIGGYVYRGAAVQHLRGAYVYGDFCDGRVRALVRDDGEVRDDRAVGPAVEGLTSFGEDADGELYVLSLEGGLHRLVPRQAE